MGENPNVIHNIPYKVEKIKYKFNEDNLLEELRHYIDSTYNQHYAQTKIQANEFIIDSGHGVGFFIGDIFKYLQRYGRKNGYDRKDLMKVLHYALLLLYTHDYEDRNRR